MRTQEAGVMSSIPTGVTIKILLAREATGNHLMNSTSLEKLRALSLVLLRSKSSMLNTIGEEGNGKPPHEFNFPRKTQSLSLAPATLEIEYATQFA